VLSLSFCAFATFSRNCTQCLMLISVGLCFPPPPPLPFALTNFSRLYSNGPFSRPPMIFHGACPHTPFPTGIARLNCVSPFLRPLESYRRTLSLSALLFFCGFLELLEKIMQNRHISLGGNSSCRAIHYEIHFSFCCVKANVLLIVIRVVPSPFPEYRSPSAISVFIGRLPRFESEAARIRLRPD